MPIYTALKQHLRVLLFAYKNLSGMTRNYQDYEERHLEKKLNVEKGENL